MEDNRPVEFDFYDDITQTWIKGTGRFLRFGSDIRRIDDDFFQVTFAVVEAEKGQVYRVPEDGLKFTDRKKLTL